MGVKITFQENPKAATDILIFWILTATRQKKNQEHFAHIQKVPYLFNLLDLQNKYNISWYCPFKVESVIVCFLNFSRDLGQKLKFLKSIC